MAKAKASLEEGLNSSANKRGLTGKDRHRYIGGALHNMGKAKTRSGKREPAPTKAVQHKAAAPATHKPTTTHHTASTPGKLKSFTPSRPTPIRDTKLAHAAAHPLELVARENKEAGAGKPYKVYSIYKKGGKTPHTSTLYRKTSTANAEIKILTDEYKQGYARKRFGHAS